MTKTGPKPRPVIERLLARIEVGEHGCWLWPGADNGPGGYGVINRNGRPAYTHIVMWEFYNGGPVPDGHEIDHECRVRRCCNPDHVVARTHTDNVRRGEKGVTSIVCSRCGRYKLGDNQAWQRRRGGQFRLGCKYCRAESSRVSKRKARKVDE